MPEPTPPQQGAFERSTLYRQCVEAARYWVIEHFLRTKSLPERMTFWVYPSGPDACLDWGNPDGPASEQTPLRGKRIRVTLEVEDN